MKSKQHGAFTIELAFVLLFTSALLVFTGDIAFQLLNRVNLDRVNYSLVNVLKERTRFFDENLIVTSAEVDELDILAARLLGYGQTSENAPYGIRVEWIVNDRYSSIDKGIEGEAPCIPGDSLKGRGHLAPQTSADKRFPLYQVTLCLNTDSWFNQFWGDETQHYIHSSSVMPGR
ncbi:tight adherence pilus pseudopilin TadF [Shewanella woodyi]|uniref:tight adherence pilus pseudopilin TadF n=1 Tax=Shewanella woodyi TaxID=60961 RepID=UPI00374A53CF